MATKASANIIVYFLFHLSIKTQANGPMIAPGSNQAIVAYASTCADPVDIVSQRIIAKFTAELVRIENICPA